MKIIIKDSLEEIIELEKKISDAINDNYSYPLHNGDKYGLKIMERLEDIIKPLIGENEYNNLQNYEDNANFKRYF